MKIGGDSLQTSSWSQMIQVFLAFFHFFFIILISCTLSFVFLQSKLRFNIYIFLQLNFIKHFLGGGFIKHMQVGFLLHFFFAPSCCQKLLTLNLFLLFVFLTLFLRGIRTTISYMMSLVSHPRKSILTMASIECLVVKR